MEKKLKRHIDIMFSKEAPTEKLKETKDEIFTNLEARVNDYINQGMDEQTAINFAIKQLPSADTFIDESKEIFFMRYLTYILQTILIYSIVLWVITIPMRIIPSGKSLNIVLLSVSSVIGVCYIIYTILRITTKFDTVFRMNTRSLNIIQKKIWILWVGLILATLILIIFSQSQAHWKTVFTSGPYHFLTSLFPLLYPAITITIPLIIYRVFKNVSKYEVNK